MNGDIDRLLDGPRAGFAWLGLIAIIVLVAAIGIVCGQGPTATAVLAAIAIFVGMLVALATLSGKKKKTSNILAVTAALSAFAGLLTSQADTIQQLILKPDAGTLLVAVVLMVAFVLTIVLFRYNHENDEQGNRQDQAPPVSATSDDEPGE